MYGKTRLNKALLVLKLFFFFLYNKKSIKLEIRFHYTKNVMCILILSKIQSVFLIKFLTKTEIWYLFLKKTRNI